MRNVHVGDEPVVEWPVVLEFKGADGMGDALDGVLVAVSEVVHRVDAPFSARTVVLAFENAVDNGVAQVQVATRHVDLRAQDVAALFKFSRRHLCEEFKVLFHTAVSVRRVGSWLRQRAAVGAYLLRVLVVDIGFAGLYEVERPLIKLFKIVGGVAQLSPLETQPLDVLHDRLDILRLLFRGVCVVKAKVAPAAKLRGHAKVEADGFRVPDVEIAVRLRWESRDHLVDRTVFKVFGYYLLDKILILIF